MGGEYGTKLGRLFHLREGYHSKISNLNTIDNHMYMLLKSIEEAMRDIDLNTSNLPIPERVTLSSFLRRVFRWFKEKMQW